MKLSIPHEQMDGLMRALHAAYPMLRLQLLSVNMVTRQTEAVPDDHWWVGDLFDVI